MLFVCDSVDECCGIAWFGLESVWVLVGCNNVQFVLFVCNDEQFVFTGCNVFVLDGVGTVDLFASVHGLENSLVSRTGLFPV